MQMYDVHTSGGAFLMRAALQTIGAYFNLRQEAMRRVKDNPEAQTSLHVDGSDYFVTRVIWRAPALVIMHPKDEDA